VFAATLKESQRRKYSVRGDLALQTALLVVAAVVVWVTAAPDARERDAVLVYRHVLAPTAILVAAAAALGTVFAARLFSSRRGRQGIPPRLQLVELFVPRELKPQVTLPMFLVAGFEAITSTPGRLLLPSSLAALFVPRGWVVIAFAALIVVNAILLASANLDSRFSASWNLLHRLFFGGWAAVVSAAVIVLGVCRVFDVQYVSTIFDGARSYTIAGYLTVAYALAWWHDYWTSTVGAIRFLDLLSGSRGAEATRIAYGYQGGPGQTNVPFDDRWIQTHGAGRLLVVRHPQAREPRFHTYDPIKMADALAGDLRAADPVRADVEWVKWRLNVHFLIAAALVVIALGVPAYLLHQLPQQAQIPEPLPPPWAPPLWPVAASTVLFPFDACTGSRPVIVVTASGGGTRAALYTASILERLKNAGQLQNVGLLSGVSGGGAALAYFAIHRTRLLSADPKAWEDYFDAMKEAYIEDVIDGSGEWRMAEGDRLGTLLAESFERHWGGQQARMGTLRDVGLLLNSAVAGRFVREDGDDVMTPLAELERRSGRSGLSDATGGRVVYTNLDVPDNFDNPPLIVPEPPRSRDARLPVFIVNGYHVLVSAAAAANANFPPVFSNAAIDQHHDSRLWVTDGGAIDNRGTEAALMTIRYALRHGAEACGRLPALHIVEIEASAFSDGYRQDRGLGSMLGGGTAFASQLDAELLAQIKERYGAPVQFHFVPMPSLLRRSGSFGTHWMLQQRITICNEVDCGSQRPWYQRLFRYVSGADRMEVTGEEVIQALRMMDQPPPASPASKIEELRKRIAEEKDQLHAENWRRLAACLRAPGGACTPDR
jgi:patatin-like phospholipase